jgi:hypothetical protein
LSSSSKVFPQITKTVLLLNGLGDILLGLGMILAAVQFASLLNFLYSPEVQYLAGGWGIATLALGGWRAVASRSSNPELVSCTAFFGLFEAGLLSLFEVMMVVLGQLSLRQVSLGLGFSSFFALAYLLCVIKSR